MMVLEKVVLKEQEFGWGEDRRNNSTGGRICPLYINWVGDGERFLEERGQLC